MEGENWVDFNQLTERAMKEGGAEKILRHYDLWNEMKVKGKEARGFSLWRQGETHREFSIDLETGRWNDFGGVPKVIAKVRKRYIGLIQGIEYSRTGRSCDPHSAGLILRDILSVQSEIREEFSRNIPSSEKTENEPFGKTIKGLRTKGLEYFEQCGIRQATVKSFGAGLAFRGFHQGRIVFPIRSADGTVMAYIGRATKPDQVPYPFRLPPGFKRSFELFSHPNLYSEEVQSVIKKSGMVLVPGMLDVVSLWQRGFPNVSATMDQGVSQRQIELLIAMGVRAVKLFFDDDGSFEKRQKTMEAAFALSENFWVRTINHDLVRKEGSGQTDPKHFSQEEQAILLNQTPIPPNYRTYNKK